MLRTRNITTDRSFVARDDDDDDDVFVSSIILKARIIIKNYFSSSHEHDSIVCLSHDQNFFPSDHFATFFNQKGNR